MLVPQRKKSTSSQHQDLHQYAAQEADKFKNGRKSVMVFNTGASLKAAKGKYPTRTSIPAGCSVMKNNFFSGPKNPLFPPQRQQARDTNSNIVRMTSGDSVEMTDEQEDRSNMGQSKSKVDQNHSMTSAYADVSSM